MTHRTRLILFAAAALLPAALLSYGFYVTVTPRVAVAKAAAVSPGAPVATPVPADLTALRRTGPAAAWAFSARRLYFTSDGRRWRDVTPRGLVPGRQPGAAFLGDQAWLAVPGEGATLTVWRTADAGRTWDSVALPVRSAADLSFADSQHGWLLAHLNGAGGNELVDLYRTADAGATWTRVASAALPPQPGAFPLEGTKTGLTFLDASTGFATARGRQTGQPWFYRSADGGATWQPQPLATVPEALSGAELTPCRRSS